MLDLIEEYEKSRALLAGRSHEIDRALRNPALQNKTREQLALRRDLLNAERIELLHRIREMKAILEVKPIEGTHQHGKGRPGQAAASGAVLAAVHQPQASGDHASGAA